jgi:hypothetical protein
MAVVRKILFALQMDWYQPGSIPYVVNALKVSAQANFSKDDAIKPIVSYLAARLHEGSSVLFTFSAEWITLGS